MLYHVEPESEESMEQAPVVEANNGASTNHIKFLKLTIL
jgi:hypothetical protein